MSLKNKSRLNIYTLVSCIDLFMLKIAALSTEETTEGFLPFLVRLSFYLFLTVLRHLIAAMLPFWEGYLTGQSSTGQNLELSGKFKAVGCSSFKHHLAQTSPPHPGVPPTSKFPKIIPQMAFMAKVYQSPSPKPQGFHSLQSLSGQSSHSFIFAGIV